MKKINVEQTAEIASLEKLYYKNPDNHEIAGLGENPQEALGYDCI